MVQSSSATELSEKKSLRNSTLGARSLFPSSLSRLLRDLRPFLGRHTCRPRLAAHAPQRHGGGILAVIRGQILDLATGEIEDTTTDDGKNAAAVALGRMGGKARAEGMTAKRRKEIANKAAKARWK